MAVRLTLPTRPSDDGILLPALETRAPGAGSALLPTRVTFDERSLHAGMAFRP